LFNGKLIGNLTARKKTASYLLKLLEVLQIQMNLRNQKERQCQQEIIDPNGLKHLVNAIRSLPETF
jgi:hypothetical protein